MPFKPKSYSIPIAPDSVAIMGLAGTFADAVRQGVFGDGAELHSCSSFQDALHQVVTSTSDVAVVPFANTLAGNVPYAHRLFYESKLHIIGEYHQPVEHNLLVIPGTQIDQVRTVHSHPHALAQCSKFFAKHAGLKEEKTSDTATAARMVLDDNDPSKASISSSLAAQIYGLEILEQGIEDARNNITRFLVLSKDQVKFPNAEVPEKVGHFITTVIFKPLRRLETPEYDVWKTLKDSAVGASSYYTFTGPGFRDEEWYMELVGHPKDQRIKNVVDELREITSEIQMIGAYPTHHFDRFPKRANALKLRQESPELD